MDFLNVREAIQCHCNKKVNKIYKINLVNSVLVYIFTAFKNPLNNISLRGFPIFNPNDVAEIISTAQSSVNFKISKDVS